MKQIKLKRGLDIPMSGEAAKSLGSLRRPSIYKIVPDHFAGLTPKMMVKEGDIVKAGSPLFHDKQFAEMLVTSPVSGRIAEINRGERRKVMYIAIEADTQIEYQTFPTACSTKEQVRELLLQSGLWTLMRQRPYDCIAMPSKQPKAIFVSSFDSAPLAPDYEYVLAAEGAHLQAAIHALSLIAPVYVGIRMGDKANVFRSLKGCELYEVEGMHPAGNVGVQINHILPIAKGETVFTINIQDLALIGRLFAQGKVDMRKRVALTGPLVREPQYYTLLPGMPVASLMQSNLYEGLPLRMVAGNALSGHQVSDDEMVSIYDNHYTVLDEGSEIHEFMGWLMPRFKAFHFAQTDPAKMLDCSCLRSLFGKKDYQWDARLKGGRRAIIVSGEYEKVFPMDIYPEYLIKAMIAGNLDKMEQLGACEVAPEDFALCEYVCTSKMPLQAIVRTALDNMKKEIE